MSDVTYIRGVAETEVCITGSTLCVCVRAQVLMELPKTERHPLNIFSATKGAGISIQLITKASYYTVFSNINLPFSP